MKNPLFIDPQYFGDYNYYKILSGTTYIVFPTYRRYEKQVFANRCLIAGANGPILLSVPLTGGRKQRTILNEVAVSNVENWQKIHWRSILSSYNSSPWFPFYRDSLAELYAKKFDFLVDWNLACLKWSLEKLKIDLRYEVRHAPSDLQETIVEEREPGPKRSGAEVRYRQVFEEKTGFLPGMSILDMLFCVGAGEVLRHLLGENT